MAKKKAKKKATTFKPTKRGPLEFSRKLLPPPIQPKIPGFMTPELEAIEGAIEGYKQVEDRVKAEKKRLTTELEGAAMELIETLQKAGQKSIVINGWSAQIVDSVKVKVKGVPKLKSEKKEEREESRLGRAGWASDSKSDEPLIYGTPIKKDNLAQAELPGVGGPS